jgi:hypothetical protein
MGTDTAEDVDAATARHSAEMMVRGAKRIESSVWGTGQ